LNKLRNHTRAQRSVTAARYREITDYEYENE
jgi:hypothetical protein